MSRSYKKYPVIKDKNSGMKKCANRKIRRSKYMEDIPNGKAYRKFSETYDICDYIFHDEFSEFVLSYRAIYPDSNKTDKELYRIWYKTYKSK